MPRDACKDAQCATRTSAAPADYLEWLRARNYSAQTVRSRRHSLNKFLSFLAESGLERFQDVRAGDLEDYRRWMRDGGLKENTRETHLHAVRGFFDYLEERSVLFENPARRIVVHKLPETLPRVIGVEEVNKLLNAPDCARPGGLRDRAMLEVLYATGTRRGELLGLTVFDPDLDNETVRVLGKGRKERVLPLGKHATAWLKRYLKDARPKLLDLGRAPTDALWLNRRHRPYSMQMLNIMIRKYARRAGFTGSVSSHTLRRSCATHMLQNGAHPLAVAKMLGHARLRTLGRYLRVTITDLKRTHAKSRPGR